MAASLQSTLKTVGVGAAVGVGTVVSALKVKSRGNVKIPQEYDGVEREANVFLFTCQLTRVLPNSRVFHHWALVLQFEDGDIRTAEGLVDEETKLYAVYTKESPQNNGKYYKLGKVFISPKKLLDLCLKNIYNCVEYWSTLQNCQSWVKALAAMLGEEIKKELNNYQSLQEAHPTFARIGGSVSAVGNYSFRPLHKMFNSSKQSS